MLSKLRVLAAFFAIVAAFGVSVAPAQEMRPYLTLKTAMTMVDGCQDLARREGWRVAIAVFDSGNNLKYFRQMDGSFLANVAIAQMKASTSARAPFPTKLLGELSKSIPGLELVPGSIIFAGGMPIIAASGDHIGGIGVSGGTNEQDEICAKAGLEAGAGALGIAVKPAPKGGAR